MSYTGEIGHVRDIESPWGNAGGVVKSTEDVLSMAKTGVGWIEDGSHVLGGRRLGAEWNPASGAFDNVVYYHDKSTGITTNALGMPGPGFESVVDEIPERVAIAHAHGKKYVMNVAPVTNDPVAEVLEMAVRSYERGVDAVLINPGCPNVRNGNGTLRQPLGTDFTGMHTMLTAVDKADLPAPVWVRTSVYESPTHAWLFNMLMRESGVVSAVLVSNSWAGHRPLRKDGAHILDTPDGTGAKSGPGVALQAREQLRWAQDYFQATKVDVVSSIGVMDAQELNTRLDLGAVAAAGTTFFYESVNGWSDDTNRMLSKLSSLR